MRTRKDAPNRPDALFALFGFVCADKQRKFAGKLGRAGMFRHEADYERGSRALGKNRTQSICDMTGACEYSIHARERPSETAFSRNAPRGHQ
jgi:hypothetical protein